MKVLDRIDQYRNALLLDVIPFWEKFSIDSDTGGYFTCLDENGNCYDTDKFIWLQGRQVYTFSKLYLEVEQNENWINIASHGIKFIDNYAFDENNDCYFSLNREGAPLVSAYNIFSDCFVAMAYAKYAAATENRTYADKSAKLFQQIVQRSSNPKGKYNKQVSENRPLKNFALPMILCNLCLELEDVIDKQLLNDSLDNCLNEITRDFIDVNTNIIYENVLIDGSKSDTFEGRLINPGHGLEATWFIMNIAERRNDLELIKRMIDISIGLLEYGWDEKYGGIFYFLDVDGHPTQQLEWDQKLWWVHLEALISLIKGYRLTRDNRCLEWFEKVHHYTWSHFPDKRRGMEWYGYLNRSGEVLLNLKGGKWKGCFHTPRALLIIYQELERIKNSKDGTNELH